MALPAVEFRTGVDDKVAYACRWLRKAADAGARTRVIGSPDDLQALDRALWISPPHEFIPHVRLREGAPLPCGAGRTPLWLGDGEVPPPAPVLLLNLGAEPPADLTGYQRVVEIVSPDPADVQSGRARWAQYRQRGCAPRHRESAEGG